MRNSTLFFLVLCLLQSCKVSHQIFETSSSNTNLRDDEFIYENDTIRISYNFWNDDGGVLAFNIFNKTSRPIYIDWRQSNFIFNGYSFNYWSDLEVEKSVARGHTQGTKYGTLMSAQSVSVTKRERPESQLPPNSSIIINKFKLNHPYANYARNQKEFTLTSTHTSMFFRNYLGYSMDKDFKNLSFVDNDFYINKIHTYRNNEYKLTTLRNNPNSFHVKKQDSNIPIIAGTAIVAFTILVLQVIK